MGAHCGGPARLKFRTGTMRLSRHAPRHGRRPRVYLCAAFGTIVARWWKGRFAAKLLKRTAAILFPGRPSFCLAGLAHRWHFSRGRCGPREREHGQRTGKIHPPIRAFKRGKGRPFFSCDTFSGGRDSPAFRMASKFGDPSPKISGRKAHRGRCGSPARPSWEFARRD